MLPSTTTLSPVTVSSCDSRATNPWASAGTLQSQTGTTNNASADHILKNLLDISITPATARAMRRPSCVVVESNHKNVDIPPTALPGIASDLSTA